jgi:hypothetical protein
VKRPWVVTAVVAMQLTAAQAPPTATISGGAVRVVLPESLLDRGEVKKQMASALTTTFVLIARGGEQSSRSRIEIRFDLWDQVYFVRRVERGRAQEQKRLTPVELRAWWRTPIHVLDAASRRATIDLQLLVLPFSAAEEGDARDWLEKSGGVGTEASTAAGIVGAVIGTTIQARPIATFRWKVVAEERR